MKDQNLLNNYKYKWLKIMNKDKFKKKSNNKLKLMMSKKINRKLKKKQTYRNKINKCLLNDYIIIIYIIY